ncbi:MAG: heavy metal translocating P-type ATPase, partial [Pseudomonadales bacterium]|nr:heavy metal translocating P-type ATPase [Pseudomonadales bacterium]
MQQPTACYHCGLPVPTGTNYSVVIGDAVRTMCCPGCQFVAQTIVETGLVDYYHYRTTPAITAEPVKQELLNELRLYDRDDIQKDFVVDLDQESAEAVVIIEGISCAACIWLIEHQIKQLNGVLSCTVNLSNNRARIQWESKNILLSEILLAIYEIGYSAHPYQPAKEDAIIQSENRNFIRRLGISGIGMMQVAMYAVALYAGAFEGMAVEHRDFLRWISLIITTPVVFYSAQPFFSSATRNLKNHHLNMDVPVSIAIAAAYGASIWSTLSQGQDVYFDSVCMFTFFLLLGRFLEFRARRKMDQTSHALSQLLPTSVTLVNQSDYRMASLRDLKAKDKILVKTGQVVAADGIIVEGKTSINEAQITGEFIPVQKQPNDKVIAGSINLENPITVEITDVGQQTRLAGILRMLDQARTDKPPIAILADNFAQYFVGFVLVLAMIVAGSWWLIEPTQAFWITLSVLVVTCPCALSLATPTALTAATAYLLKRGFMITHSHTIEGLAQASHIVFDKTGTLTQGKFVLEKILTIHQITKHQCHMIAAALETHSEHPIAQAFKSAPITATSVKVETGAGIEGEIEGVTYRIGHPDYVLALSGKSLRDASP